MAGGKTYIIDGDGNDLPLRAKPADGEVIVVMSFKTAGSVDVDWPAHVRAIQALDPVAVYITDHTPEAADLEIVALKGVHGHAVLHTKDRGLKAAFNAGRAPAGRGWRGPLGGPGMRPVPAGPPATLETLVGPEIASWIEEHRLRCPDAPWWQLFAELLCAVRTGELPGRGLLLFPVSVPEGESEEEMHGVARQMFGSAPIALATGPAWQLPVPAPKPPSAQVVAVRALPGAIQVRDANGQHHHWVLARVHCSWALGQVCSGAGARVRAPRGQIEDALAHAARSSVTTPVRVYAQTRWPKQRLEAKRLDVDRYPSWPANPRVREVLLDPLLSSAASGKVDPGAVAALDRYLSRSSSHFAAWERGAILDAELVLWVGKGMPWWRPCWIRDGTPVRPAARPEIHVDGGTGLFLAATSDASRPVVAVATEPGVVHALASGVVPGGLRSAGMLHPLVYLVEAAPAPAIQASAT